MGDPFITVEQNRILVNHFVHPSRHIFTIHVDAKQLFETIPVIPNWIQDEAASEQPHEVCQIVWQTVDPKELSVYWLNHFTTPANAVANSVCCWDAYFTSADVMDEFFNIVYRYDPLAPVSAGVVLAFEYLHAELYAAALWEKLTVGSFTDLLTSDLSIMLTLPRAHTYGILIISVLKQRIGEFASIVHRIPRRMHVLIGTQAWVPIKYAVPLTYDVDWCFFNSSIHGKCVIGNDGNKQLHVTSTMLHSSTLFINQPTAIKMVHRVPILHNPGKLKKDKSVYISPLKTVTLCDSQFKIGSSDMQIGTHQLAVKDVVLIMRSGLFLVKSGRALYMSGMGVKRLRLDLSDIEWILVAQFDEDILDYGSFTTNCREMLDALICEYITVATESRMYVYKIMLLYYSTLVRKQPTVMIHKVMEMNTENHFVVSYQLLNHSGVGGVWFTDGRSAYKFMDVDGVQCLSKTKCPIFIVPKIQHYGIDKWSKRLNFGFYGMYSPDLPGPSDEYNFYYRFINYMQQYDMPSAFSDLDDDSLFYYENDTDSDSDFE